MSALCLFLLEKASLAERLFFNYSKRHWGGNDKNAQLPVCELMEVLHSNLQPMSHTALPKMVIRVLEVDFCKLASQGPCRGIFIKLPEREGKKKKVLHSGFYMERSIQAWDAFDKDLLTLHFNSTPTVNKGACLLS